MNLWSHLGEEPPPLVKLFDPLPPVQIERANTALLIVDMDNGSTREDGGLVRLVEAEGISAQYYKRRLAEVVPNIATLIAAFRRSGLEVVYTKGRGSKGGHKLGGYQVRPLRSRRSLTGETDGREIRSELAPAPTDLVLEKDTPGPFGVTNIDHALRNLDITRLVVTGIVTDQCVEATVRGAFDFGYQVILVEDACATFTEQLHMASLRVLADWFCRLATTEEIASLAHSLETEVHLK
jgi:nicotinamidase-related amidase